MTAKRIIWTPEMLAALCRMRERGDALALIAEYVGVSYEAANLKLRELGYPRKIERVRR